MAESNRLSRAQFDAALAFVAQHGRSTEKALARHLFEKAQPDTVCAALEDYRNRDGGFGHGLEPDLLLPDSSAIATTIALQILADINAPSNHPMVVDALVYLTQTYDVSSECWLCAPPSVNEYPHAPWWHYDGSKPGSDLAMNPGAEIVGHFVRWRSAAQAAPVEAWLEATLQTIVESDQIEPHQLLCCVRLAESPGLAPGDRHAIAQRLEASIETTVQTDPAAWSSYCIKPLTAAPRPDSLLADTLADAISDQLDFELQQQDARGAWQPHWSWYGNYPEAWARVQPGIAALTTLNTLRALQIWDRIQP